MSDHRYHRVSPKFWTASQTELWSEDARLLALYLLTGPHRTTEGLFRLPKSYICEDLEWSPERLAEPFAELLARGFIEYDESARWLLIVGALKWQTIENVNQAKGALKRVVECPSASPLTSRFKQLAERYAERLAELLPEGFGEQIGNPHALALAHAQTQTPILPESRVGIEALPVDNLPGWYTDAR